MALPFALGHKQVPAKAPFPKKVQPVEGMTNGIPAGKGNDASSRSPQPSGVVKKVATKKAVKVPTDTSRQSLSKKGKR